MTPAEVNDTVAQALASATPPPAFSGRVYQAIQPSLVLIQAQTRGANGEDEHGLGSGVIINDQGDILTSSARRRAGHRHPADLRRRHAVAGADDDQQPEHDIAVLRAQQPPGADRAPPRWAIPNAMHVGDEAFVVGNPFGLYSSMSAGVISGFGRSFQPVDSNQSCKT